jgi:hypothetical protein
MVSSEKNVMYLELKAYLGQKKPMAQNSLFITIYFLRNIVCTNNVCDMGLTEFDMILEKLWKYKLTETRGRFHQHVMHNF